MRRLLVFLFALAFVACQDAGAPLQPEADASASLAPQGAAALFRQASPEVMSLPGTVFAARDDATGQLVVGVENSGAARAVERVLAARGTRSGAFRIELASPIHFMSDNLRSEHRPTVGGIQLHWDDYACTLGFNVTHSGGRSFITNSHCTSVQGQNSGTVYNQPLRSTSPNPIADEADDPAYSAGLAGCSSGKRCRRSDAARALYRAGASSSQGVIAKPTGVNNGSLTVAGNFTITSQNDNATTFSGTLHKVGRTTGWTSGNVTNTCATVNVSGSDIQLLCQTLVQRRGRQIVGGGDSGSPVFRVSSGDNVELVGILWGGSINGDLFVFSPLKNIQDELGSITATAPPSSPTPPSAPGDLTATAAGATQIELEWSHSGGAHGFEVERCQGSGCSNFSQIALLTSGDARGYTDGNLAAGTTYRYRVRAYNADGDSGYSNTAEATTQADQSPSDPLRASFTYSCGNSATCHFKDTSTGDPMSWSWSFPGGEPSSSTQPNPQTSFSTTGDKLVTLQITRNGATSQAQQTITCRQQGPFLRCR